MFARTVTAALFLMAIATGPAFACKGEELYSDDFSEKTDFWTADFVTIENGVLRFSGLNPGYNGRAAFGVGKLEDFDACVDLKFPAAKNPDGGTIAGLSWSVDKDNYYVVWLAPAGSLGVFRYTGGRVLVMIPVKVRPQIKAGEGSTNKLRLTMKGGSGTVYVNDEKIGTFKPPGAKGGGWIGLYASMENDQKNDWEFSNFKITEPSP